MVGQPAVGEDPAVDARVERLDPAVEHLREPGHGGHVGHRQPGVAERAGGAAGRHELEAGQHEPRAEVGESGLVRDRQQRAARDRQGRVGTIDIEDDPAPVRRDRERAGEQQPDRARQEPMLDRADPVVEGLGVVAGQDRDGLLGDDRSAIERRVDEMDRAAGDRHPVREGVSDRVRAREGRQQRRVRVEDPPGERGEHRRPDDPHVAGEDDDVGLDRRPASRPASRRRRRGPARSRCPARSPSRAPGRPGRRRPGRSRRRARRGRRPRLRARRFDPAPETPTAIRPGRAVTPLAPSGPST